MEFKREPILMIFESEKFTISVKSAILRVMKPIFAHLISLILLINWACSNQKGEGQIDQKKEEEKVVVSFDLDEIIARDTLKAITVYSSTSYFLYQGRPMGYDYELAQRFAEYLGVELEMIIADDIDEILSLLEEGKGDVVSYNLTVTKARREEVSFSYPLNFTHQVLVQKKPDNWRDMKLHEIEQTLIRNPIKMIGSNISIRKNSSYHDRLENLQEELGGVINIDYVPGSLSTDEIIEMVNDGEIEYTIADYNIAKINSSYYHNIDIETTIGVMQQLAWAVRKNSPQLLTKLNEWLEIQRNETDFYVIYNKYFNNQRAFNRRVKSDYFSMEGGKISPHDDMIKAVANEIQWDWRFLAAQIFQESRFDPKEESWAGAQGLLQLMPKTAASYGYKNLKDPQTSLKAGTAHIKFLDDYWREEIPDSTERVKFILASYNAGQNHVRDARNLAKKNGLDPNIWFDNVEKGMLMKSKKKFFNDPVVKYGYCRGVEPVNYVKEILERYHEYTKFIDENSEKVKV